jgi:hypothetical protein
MLLQAGWRWDPALSKKASLCGRWVGTAYTIENMRILAGRRRTHFWTPDELLKTSLALDI